MVQGIMITVLLFPADLGVLLSWPKTHVENQVCIRVGCGSLIDYGWPRCQSEHCLWEEPNYRVQLVDNRGLL